jgi:hypothetical protein
LKLVAKENRTFNDNNEVLLVLEPVADDISTTKSIEKYKSKFVDNLVLLNRMILKQS